MLSNTFSGFCLFFFFPTGFKQEKFNAKQQYTQNSTVVWTRTVTNVIQPTSAHKLQNTDHFVERRVIQHVHKQTETWLFTGGNRGAVGQFQNLLPEVVLSHLMVPQQLVEDLQHTSHHLPLGEETVVHWSHQLWSHQHLLCSVCEDKSSATSRSPAHWSPLGEETSVH